MLEKYIRTPYQKVLVNPVGRYVTKKRYLSPNMATLLATVFGLGVPLFLWHQQTILSVIFLLLSGYFDTLDGTLARMQTKCSDQGCALDLLSDRLVETAVVVGLYLMAPELRGLLCLFMLGSILLCVTSFLLVGLFSSNAGEKSFHYSPGLIERPEAFIFFTAMILFPWAFNWLASVFILLILWTTFYRVYQFIRQSQLSSEKQQR